MESVWWEEKRKKMGHMWDQVRPEGWESTTRREVEERICPSIRKKVEHDYKPVPVVPNICRRELSRVCRYPYYRSLMWDKMGGCVDV